MAHIDDLVKQVGDPQLRAALAQQVATLTSRKQFGLVFQEHSPESVRLPQQRVRTGDKVELRESKESVTFHVISTKASLDVATVVELDESGETVGEPQDVLKADLVVVKPFGDPVYPGLRQAGEAGSAKPGQPTHVVINGENFHALQALEYTHAGKVDLIYIDPPYNTGAADWKYNDKYIDGGDSYRHSKWLSFMEKRLKIAKSLLKNTGSLMISIDDNEYARLKMLADQVFGEQNFVSSFIWKGRSGGQGNKSYNRNHEHVLVYSADSELFVSGRGAAVSKDFPLAHKDGRRYKRQLLRKWGGTSLRSDRPNQFYALTAPDGSEVYPLHSDGAEGHWRWGKPTMQKNMTEDRVEFLLKDDGWTAYERVFESSEDSGVAYTTILPEDVKTTATGSTRLANILGRKSFSFPKPVELLTRLIEMSGAPANAVVVDFFAGSGTTAEAVIQLNGEDGGTRQAILVTNNELSKSEDSDLRKKGFRPGDSEYEAMGVFHHVTKPRISTVLTGVREDGSKYSDGIDGQSAAFFDLTYEDENLVSLGNRFEAIAPLLWMQSGATGELIAKRSDITKGEEGYSVPADCTYAVIFDTDSASEAITMIALHGSIKQVFIVSDSDSDYRAITAKLPGGLKNTAVKLYSNYLRSFEINQG